MSLITKPIQVIAGLGNPGLAYEKTRHNAGFWLLDALAQTAGVSFKLNKPYQAETATIHLFQQGTTSSVILIKPLTFMNLSGHSVVPLMRFYRLPPESLLVVHDELDILPGEVRLKQGGSNGGHNGLKDIQAQLGTPHFWRLRLGIGHPRRLNLNQDVADFVLSKPSKDHHIVINEVIHECLKAIPSLYSTHSTDLSTVFNQTIHTLHSLK